MNSIPSVWLNWYTNPFDINHRHAQAKLSFRGTYLVRIWLKTLNYITIVTFQWKRALLDSVQKHTKSRSEILVGIYFFSTIDAHFIWSVIKICPWAIYWTATMTNLMSICYYRLYLLLWDNTLRWLFDATVAMCMCIADVIYNVLFYYFFLLKQYHRWILMDVFVKKSQTHVDLLSVKQFQNLWHWCKK